MKQVSPAKTAKVPAPGQKSLLRTRRAFGIVKSSPPRSRSSSESSSEDSATGENNDDNVTVEAENLKKHLGLREKSFVTLSETDQAEVGGRLKELLHIVSDGAFVPLINWCTEECHVRKLCALKGIVTDEFSSSSQWMTEDVKKEEPKDEPEEEPIVSDSDVDEMMAEADADIKAQVWDSTETNPFYYQMSSHACVGLSELKDGGYLACPSLAALIITGCPTSLLWRLITCDCPFLPLRREGKVEHRRRLRLLSVIWQAVRYRHRQRRSLARGVRKQPRTAFSGMRLFIHGHREWEVLIIPTPLS